MFLNSVVSNKNRPNFKANIIFSEKEYYKLPLSKMIIEKKYVGFPYIIEDSKMLKEGFSDGASVCTMGFIRSKVEDRGYFSHCIPAGNPFEEVKKRIVPVLKEFKSFGAPIEGILTGAAFGNQNSMKQAYNFMDLFDDFGVHYSAFLGQFAKQNNDNEPLGVNMFVSTLKNKYILDLNQNEPISSFSDLQKRFYIIKKAPQDNIIYA